MGSTNFTTHYDIPIPLGSDKTTPMDYNQSMQDVDTALFEAHGNAASAIAGLEITNGNVAQNADDIDALEGRMTTAEGTLVTQGNAINNLGLEVADVRTDGQDMITAYKEATAQSTHAYAVGDYFVYNDVLYKATESIAIGDTIVPDTNCKTTNVSSELIQIKSDLSERVELIRVFGDAGSVKATDFGFSQNANLQTKNGENGYRLALNAQGNLALFSTTDDGAHWTIVRTFSSDEIEGQTFGNKQWVALQAINGQNGYRLSLNSTGELTLFKTVDGGDNWALDRTL